MRIAVAMSGGVDSSVAALLLARQGAEVVGVSMHLWDHDRDGTGAGEGRCCTLDDLRTARRAAEVIGVAHYTLDLRERFIETVVRPFVSSYLSGETPVPCLACNTDVKFDALFRRARALGCEAVATGHYARIETDPATGEASLLKARDLGKDQTYFLYDLTPGQLSIARFPLGELLKSDVREIAREAGLPNWDKPDSQEICFVPAADGPAGFIRREAEALGFALPGHPAALPGPVVRADGTELGTHPGTMGFTVGQRRGLGVAAGEALYVVGIEAGERRLVVGGDGEVLSREVHLRALNFLVPAPEGEIRVLARIRSRHPDVPALLVPEEPGVRRGGQARLLFDDPVRAAAPGQAAVFYDPVRPERLLGGGLILGTGGPPSGNSGESGRPCGGGCTV
ncbi:MAG: tRNA 2-thiouridine(34) synthase MnmA [Holophagales bacterium]|nr:tRNA 2-thiouridine(34) synthase MnmA [Holophagales bacterium]